MGSQAETDTIFFFYAINAVKLSKRVGISQSDYDVT